MYKLTLNTNTRTTFLIMDDIIENSGLIRVCEMALSASTSSGLSYSMQKQLSELYKKRNEFIEKYPYNIIFTLKASKDLS